MDLFCYLKNYLKNMLSKILHIAILFFKKRYYISISEDVLSHNLIQSVCVVHFYYQKYANSLNTCSIQNAGDGHAATCLLLKL